jgi:hypothetical protein
MVSEEIIDCIYLETMDIAGTSRVDYIRRIIELYEYKKGEQDGKEKS